jgi:hypothetical protein
MATEEEAYVPLFRAIEPVGTGLPAAPATATVTDNGCETIAL